MDFDEDSHSLGESNFHFQFTCLNKEFEAELARLKDKDDTPEMAFADMIEDERFLKHLYEKFKAFKPSG